MEIIAFTINLEHIGDIIDKNLMELAAKKIKNRLSFSEEGAAELQALHRRVLDNLKLALGVFISGDVKIARQLLEEKAPIREAERAAAENHFARLREGRWRASRPARCISTSCATSSAFILISARSPIRSWRRPAS